MRFAFSLSLLLLLPACGGDDEDTCASGVRADGVCLVAKNAAGSGGGGPVGRMPGAACDASDVLICGHTTPGVPDTLLLSCTAGAYVEVSTCPQMGVCTETLPGKSSVHCDDMGTPLPLAKEGTSCEGAAAACSLDQTKLLGCKDMVWTSVKTCAAPAVCRRTEAGTTGPGWSCPSSGPCAVCK